MTSNETIVNCCSNPNFGCRGLSSSDAVERQKHFAEVISVKAFQRISLNFNSTRPYWHRMKWFHWNLSGDEWYFQVSFKFLFNWSHPAVRLVKGWSSDHEVHHTYWVKESSEFGSSESKRDLHNWDFNHMQMISGKPLFGLEALESNALQKSN